MSEVRILPLEPHEDRSMVGPRPPNPPMLVRFWLFVPFFQAGCPSGQVFGCNPNQSGSTPDPVSRLWWSYSKQKLQSGAYKRPPPTGDLTANQKIELKIQRTTAVFRGMCRAAKAADCKSVTPETTLVRVQLPRPFQGSAHNGWCACFASRLQWVRLP